jgi:glycosyltransferase involved in cell wall biosynthesis
VAPDDILPESAMKILQLISSAGQYGAENMMLELSTALEKLGCVVVVGVLGNNDDKKLEVYRQAKERGLNAQLMPCAGRFDTITIRHIKSCVLQNGIELLHSHGYKSNVYGYLATRKLRVDRIATCHGWPGSSPALQAYYRLDKFLLRKFDRIVAVSDTIVGLLERAGIPTDKISLISNGVDTVRFQSSNDAGKSGSCVWSRKRVGVVARLAKEKGIPFLLTAAKDVLQEFPDTEFCLIGDGPERGHLESLARELGIEKNVKFWGTRTDMPSVYAQLDVFVLPSLQEGLPMAVLEALAAGKPVIATRVGAVPKLVIPGKTGILIEAGDAAAIRNAISVYLRDPAIGLEFGVNGAKHIRENYSAISMAGSYLEIYRECVVHDKPNHTGRVESQI